MEKIIFSSTVAYMMVLTDGKNHIQLYIAQLGVLAPQAVVTQIAFQAEGFKQDHGPLWF